MEIELPIKTKFLDEAKARWVFTPDVDNGWSVTVYSLEGEPLCGVTKNIESVQASKSQLMVKDYSENKGMFECLVANNILRADTPIQLVPAGFTNLLLCKIAHPFYIQLKNAHPEYFDADDETQEEPFKVQINSTGEAVLKYNEDRSYFVESHDFTDVKAAMDSFGLSAWSKTYVIGKLNDDGSVDLKAENIIAEDEWPEW